MRKNKYGATAFLAGVLLLSLNACSGNGAEEIADVEQQAGASRVTLIEATINVSETNTLQTQLEATLGENAVKVQKLVLTGEMRAVDMYYLRESLNDLQELDMSAVTTKASNYTDSDNYWYGISDNGLLSELLAGKMSLRSLQFPSTIISIPFRACIDCTALQSIEIPSSVTTIEWGAFQNTPLTSVDLANVQSIGSSAFSDCSSLTSVTFSNQLTSIGGSTFANTGLTAVELPSSVTTIEWGAFQNTPLTSVDLANVQRIDDYAFSNCSSLTSVTLSNQLTSIGSRAFADTGLTAVEIPPSVTTIEDGAFNNTQLTTLTVPSTVTSVTGCIINDCPKLQALFWHSSALIEDIRNTWNNNNNCFLYITSNGGTPAGYGPNWKTVIIDGVAETIELTFKQNGESTPGFYVPQAFTAKKISFTRNFSGWGGTEIGASGGWYTLTLPFTPTTITHPEKGQLAPFGSSVEGAKPFWLRKLTSEGFVDVTTMEANVPYLLSLPNNSAYLEEYNITGEVTFSAENVQIPATPDVLPVLDGPTFQLCPTYQYAPKQGNVYALNTNHWVDDYNYGSVFVRSAQEVYPFEAYAVVPSSAAPAVLSLDFRSANSRAAGVRNTTGIPQIGDK